MIYLSLTTTTFWFVVGLNDDKWHRVAVTIDLLTARLTVDVTSSSTRERRLMTLMTSAITSSTDESRGPVTSIISLGGACVDAATNRERKCAENYNK